MADVRTGTVVYSADGHKLGKIVDVQGDQIVIEKGFFFPTDYICRRSDIAGFNADDDGVRLALTKAQLESGYTGSAEATTRSGAYEDTSLRSGLGGARIDDSSLRERDTLSGSASTETRIPLEEEELDVQKRTRKAGGVRVTKNVVTETKRVDVPVTREEVHVERVPASGDTTANVRGAFQEETISVPVVEEEVEIRKRPVVREEVRISKTAHQETRNVSEQVRREEAEVHEDTDLEREDEERTSTYATDDSTGRHI